MSPNRIAAVSAVALASAALLSCGGNERDTGLFADVQVTLTQAPVDATCLTITIAGQTHNASKSIPLTLNQMTTGFLITTAPVGADEVTAQAFAGSCNPGNIPTWEGAIAFAVVAGITNNVTVPMIHLANTSVGINFQDEPHTSTTLAGSPGLSGTTDGTGSVARFSGPQDSVPDNAGNLYVTDTNNHTIRKVVISSGATTTIAGTAGTAGETNGTGTAATFTSPTGITTDGTNLYVTDFGNGTSTGCTIRQIVISSAAVTTIDGTANACSEVDGNAATSRFASPSGIVYTNNGLGPALWVVDGPFSGISTIRYINLTNHNVVTIAGSPTTAGYADGAGNVSLFNFAHGITTDGNDLYVADSSNSLIRNIAPQNTAALTNVTTLAGTGTSTDADGIGLFASFSGPIGTAYDGAGNIYVSDNGPRIRKVVISNGAVLTVSGTTSGSTDGTGPAITFTVPRHLSMDANGALYVTDSTENTVRKM